MKIPLIGYGVALSSKTHNKFVNVRPLGWTLKALLRSNAARYKGVIPY
ncbi:hypothetical protein [Veronia nyctiphanis]|nr:hypothetical protein [Veronia nyctiphanis]